MMLSPGVHLGAYEILSLLGAGGMGEVYRARDPKLQRDVAIKVLPTRFSTEPDRLARFEREAHALAALQHSGIAGIHELLEHDGARYLVLEYVEGESLAALISRGALPVDDAIAIGRQIATALEAAHEKGIIHRDLKPANIMVSPDGHVKLLDFGLAKALDPISGASSAPSAVSQSPTMMTMTGGMILGTAAYMSPEQARGKPVDRRADIWAFGCVLYEMLTAVQAFGGETVSDTIAAVMRAQPDWQRLPPDTPPYIAQLVRRCLVKDVQDRLPHIGVARLEIASGGTDSHAVVPVRSRRWMDAVPWAIAAVLAIATIAMAVVSFRGREMSATPVVQFDLAPPAETERYGHLPGQRGAGAAAPHFAVSPDGSTIAFVAMTAPSTPRLWVRRLSSTTPRVLQGTEDAAFPFWSPDNRKIGFFANGSLKTIAVADGAAVTIASAPDGEGGSWASNGDILYAPTLNGGIWRVAQSGGTPVQVTTPERGKVAHRWPHALPGGQSFVYVARDTWGPERSVIRLHSPDRPDDVTLVETISRAIPSVGHLLYHREGKLYAHKLDLRGGRLTGDPVLVAQDVAFNNASRAGFHANDSGVLLFRTGVQALGLARVVWRSRDGSAEIELDKNQPFARVAISPDGRRAVVQVNEPGVATDTRSDLWMYDLGRGVRTRFSTESGFESAPVWSRDGRSVAYSVADTQSFAGASTVWIKSAGGTEPAKKMNQGNGTPRDWTLDGKAVLVSRRDNENVDLWLYPIDGGTARPLLTTPFNETDGAFSPDGRWLAYLSNESGGSDVYLQPYPATGHKWRVSSTGATGLRWIRGTDELVFQSQTNLVAVTVKNQPDPLSDPVTLFTSAVAAGFNRFDVTTDGKRFLMVAPRMVLDEEGSLRVMLNWPQLLRQP